ncbi:MAG: DUF4105 domain-containing protein [Pseudomonas sp.]
MLRPLILTLLSLIIAGSGVWALLALWYQLSWQGIARQGLLVGWVLAVISSLVALWYYSALLAVLGHALLFACVLFWWSTIKPSNDRDWTDDLAQNTTGVIEGDTARVFNVRNFDWTSLEDYQVRWENREYDLTRLTSVDMITSHWGVPGVAHVLVSFGFGNDEYVVFSVEIRREQGQSFSEVGGFFKKFELSVVATDERDAVRVRTNVRDEDVYIYRTRIKDDQARRLFAAFVEEANQLAATPRFYHTVTANCTTLVFRMMRKIIPDLPLDYRLLLSGHLPSYVQQVGGLQKELSLDELQRRGRITDRALQAGEAEDFSRQIRVGVPGWE